MSRRWRAGRYVDSGTAKWRHRDGRPPFEAGDVVYPTYPYPGWPKTEGRAVKAVEHEPLSDEWKVRIWNPAKKFDSKSTPGGDSLYNPHNLTKEAPMATEAKKYYGERVGGMNATTELYLSYHAAEQGVRSRIREGEVWRILAIEAELTGEPPRPPVTVRRFS